MKMNALELENRLIGFAASVINFSDHVKKTRAGIYLAGQIVRSGTSPALNYAEARSAESKKILSINFPAVPAVVGLMTNNISLVGA